MIRRVLLFLFLMTTLATASHARNSRGFASEELERQSAFADAIPHGYVASGCLHATSGTTSVTMPGCRAVTRIPGVQSEFVQAPSLAKYAEETVVRTITYSAGDGLYYLIAHGGSVTEAVGGWNRVQNTIYLWAYSATVPVAPLFALPPALPANAVYLSRSQVLAGVIATVYDMRDLSATTSAVVAERYGAIGNGLSDEHAAIEAACVAVRSRFIAYGNAPQTLQFSPGKVYKLTATAVCVLPDGEVFIEAGGAKFVAGFDGLLLWLRTSPLTDVDNGLADCTNATNWTNDLRFVHWHGGDFRADDYPSSVLTTAIRGGAIRGLTIDNLRIQGLAIGLHVCIQDSFRMTGSRIQALRYGIYQPDSEVDYASVSGNTSGVLIQGNIMGGVDTTVSMVYLCGGRMRSINILNNDFNGEATTSSIYFCGAEDNPRGANFTVNIKNNHFEQLLSTGRYVWIDDVPNVKGWKNVSITGNQMVMPTASIAVQLKNVRGGVIGPNAVSCLPGATMYKIEGDTRELIFMVENRDGNCDPYIDYSGLVAPATRKDFTLVPSQILYDVAERTEEDSTGASLFNSTTTLAISGTVTIDMSRTLNLGTPAMNSKFPQPRPKAWIIEMKVRDLESFTSAAVGVNYTVPYMLLARETGLGHGDQLVCSPAGLPDNGWAFCEGIVPANDDGDIIVTWVGTAANSMTAAIFVKGFIQ